ncbi:dynein regulatory complex protein 10-like [Watersipora subatra]|uniref:dynein regulatory complex protein 10-like n=1 Tax=Watersipora subatra TaxID=2589382 RepID=UPI00355C1F5D
MTTLTEVQPLETIQMRLPLGSQPLPASPSAAAKRNKIKLDPLRALEPAKKKLTTIESQRVMCVLEDTKRRCDIVAALPHIIKNLDKFSSMVPQEVAECLAEHKKFHAKFVALELKHTDIGLRISNSDMTTDDPQEAPKQQPSPPTSRPTSRNLGSRGSTRYRQSPAKESASADLNEQLENIITQIKMVELELQINIKNMMRVMNLHPGVANMLVCEVGNSRSREGLFFTTQLNELRDVLMEKLLMTPLEEKEKMRYLSQVSAQERQNAVVIETLEEQLRIANEGKDHEIRLKNDIIRKLQNDLHMLEKATEEEIKRTKTEAEKQEAADSKNSEGKKEKLTAEHNELKAKHDNLTSEHREEEQTLRRKKWKIETEVENWIQKYDQDMGEKQDEFEEIDGVYTEEKKQLNELEERFKTLESEYKTITEARNKAKEERETAEREMSLMIKAATTIQAVWRSYKVRKALKQKNKKGKKSKK